MAAAVHDGRSADILVSPVSFHSGLSCNTNDAQSNRGQFRSSLSVATLRIQPFKVQATTAIAIASLTIQAEAHRPGAVKACMLVRRRDSAVADWCNADAGVARAGRVGERRARSQFVYWRCCCYAHAWDSIEDLAAHACLCLAYASLIKRLSSLTSTM